MVKRLLKTAPLGLLGLMLLPGQGLGYIQPAGSILASVTARRARINFKNIVAEGYVIKGTERFELWEAIQSGRARRQELKKGDETRVDLTIGKRRWQYKMGSAAGAPQRTQPTLVMTFLGSSKRDRGNAKTKAFLSRHNIDTSVVSMNRLGERVAFVIGAKHGEMDKPQLWIDKQLRVPIRLITNEKGARWDMRLLGYGSGATSEWMPYRIELYQNDKLVETTVYKRAEINVSIDSKIFEEPQ